MTCRPRSRSRSSRPRMRRLPSSVRSSARRSSGCSTQEGIVTIPSAHCETLAPGELVDSPGARRTLHFDRIVALPQLFGPSTPGVPKRTPSGFSLSTSTAACGALENVYAAGDATDFPVKHGGIAAQQADAAARGDRRARRRAGRAQAVSPGDPRDPARRRQAAVPERAHHRRSRIGLGDQRDPDWSPPAKIAATYLAPYLARDRPRYGDLLPEGTQEREQAERPSRRDPDRHRRRSRGRPPRPAPGPRATNGLRGGGRGLRPRLAPGATSAATIPTSSSSI